MDETETLCWVLKAIRDRNYIGAECVLDELLQKKAGKISEVVKDQNGLLLKEDENWGVFNLKFGSMIVVQDKGWETYWRQCRQTRYYRTPTTRYFSKACWSFSI